MKKPCPRIITLATLTLALAAGCTTAPIQIGVRANQAVPSGISYPVQGKACGFQLLLIIPIAINSRYERAYAQLRATAGTDFITEVQIQDQWKYGFVGTTYCTSLTARAIRAVANATPPPSIEPLSPIISAPLSISPPALAPPSAAGPVVAPMTIPPSVPQEVLARATLLRIRPLPDTTGAIQMPTGMVVTRISSSPSVRGEKWWYVSINGQEGWISDADLAR